MQGNKLKFISYTKLSINRPLRLTIVFFSLMSERQKLGCLGKQIVSEG